MKHYVLGFIFNETKDRVLLVKKKRPIWQAGRWNGIGGKIEDDDESPIFAMNREGHEETNYRCFDFVHCITFVCPGGTVYVYKGNSGVNGIPFKQVEDERLKVWSLNELPANIDSDLRWIIPVCLSTIQFPLLVQQNTLLGE